MDNGKWMEIGNVYAFASPAAEALFKLIHKRCDEIMALVAKLACRIGGVGRRVTELDNKVNTNYDKLVAIKDATNQNADAINQNADTLQDTVDALDEVSTIVNNLCRAGDAEHARVTNVLTTVKREVADQRTINKSTIQVHHNLINRLEALENHIKVHGLPAVRVPEDPPVGSRCGHYWTDREKANCLTAFGEYCVTRGAAQGRTGNAIKCFIRNHLTGKGEY